MNYCDNCGAPVPRGIFGEDRNVSPKLPGKSMPEYAVEPFSGFVGPSVPGDKVVHAQSLMSTRGITRKSPTQPAFARAPQRGLERELSPSRQRSLGVSMVAFGVLALLAGAASGLVGLGGLGLASFLIGLLILYLPSRPAVSPQLVQASFLSSLANLERVMRDIAPETKAVYMKVNDRLDVPMVFIPLADNPAPTPQVTLSDNDRFLLVDLQNERRTGLLLEAPGASLLQLIEAESGIDFFDMDDRNFISALATGMVESVELASRVRIKITENQMNLVIVDGPLHGLADSVEKHARNFVRRLGCPLCSAAVCAAVKAVKRDLLMEDATHNAGQHSIHVKIS